LSLDENEGPLLDQRSRKNRNRLLVLLAVTVVLVTACVIVVPRAFRSGRGGGSDPSTSAASAQPLTGEQVYQRLIRSAAMVVSPHRTGSGFVVHAENRLVVTNFHVVGSERRVAVVFPLYDARGELVTDAQKYPPRIEELAVKGEVIDVSRDHDLALIRLDQLPAQVAAVPLAKHPAPTGSVVYSVGGSGAEDNLLWRLTKGTVRGRSPRRQATDFGVVDCTILETDSPVNRGDSGGAVMNDRGELVAVVSHFDLKQRQVSGNIDIEEVRGFVSRHLGTDARSEPVPGGAIVLPGSGWLSNNRGKILGKWKITGGTDMSAEQLKILESLKIYPFMEFKEDGTGSVGADSTDEDTKKLLLKSPEKTVFFFKYKLNFGDEVELYDLPKELQYKTGRRPFGQKDRARLQVKIDGENMTATDEDTKESRRPRCRKHCARKRVPPRTTSGCDRGRHGSGVRQGSRSTLREHRNENPLIGEGDGGRHPMSGLRGSPHAR
jgi:S1-C subfamily serine protease